MEERQFSVEIELEICTTYKTGDSSHSSSLQGVVLLLNMVRITEPPLKAVHMKRVIALGIISLLVSACSSNKPTEPGVTSAKPVINEIFTASKTLEGAFLKYPDGKAEMRLYRVEIPVGGKIPLHKHPAPMMVYVQGVNSGSLRNTRVMSDGSEIKTIFKPGQAFLKGVDTPHYSENVGNKPTILWVTVTSAEDIPTTVFLN